jgi:hypothetical protein
MFWQFAGVVREQAERSSGNAAKQAVAMPELRRQGSWLPSCTDSHLEIRLKRESSVPCKIDHTDKPAIDVKFFLASQEND